MNEALDEQSRKALVRYQEMIDEYMPKARDFVKTVKALIGECHSGV